MTINIAPISITAVADNKVYDGTTNASVTLTVNGAVLGDELTATGTASFDTADVGVGKTVTVSGIVLEGANASNYAYSDTATTTADITKADPVVTVIPYSVDYDGVPHSASGTATGVLGESLDGLNLSSTTHTAAGTYNTDPWTFTDAAGNYNDASGTVSDVIGQVTEPVTLNGLSQTFNGAPESVSASTTLNGLQIDVTYNGSTTAPTNAGSYAIVASINDPNYTGTATGTLVIAPAIPQVVNIGGSSGGGGGGGGGGGFFNPTISTSTNNGGGLVLGASSTNTAGLLQTLLNLEQQLVVLEFKANSCSVSFNKNLSKGMTDPDVKHLQMVLNFTSLTQVAATGPGSPGNESTYFGSATKNAVIAFQNIFADQILTPNGLTSGTGYVGSATRAVLNNLCGE
ncbi:MAG: MBG domain-containing protein [Minisyncoccia bacterium]